MARSPSLLVPSLALLIACTGEGGYTKVYNTPPAVSIQQPPSGTESEEGEPIVFQGQVIDDQDAEPDLTLLWSSDLDGVLSDTSVADADGNVEFTTANLSPGNHVITLKATDTESDSDQDDVEIVILSVPDAPTITMVHPLSGEYAEEGEAFEFVALVDDEQDDPTALLVTFSSDIDGEFCAPTPDAVGKVACEWDLSPGGHVLTYTVVDSDGLDTSVSAYFEVLASTEIDADHDGFTPEEGDCDDGDADVKPTAEESANGEDDDCDGDIDEDTVASDDDGDGQTELEGDCDDDDDDTYTGATEVCDGIDNDCDSETDEGTSCLDDDGDGYTELSGDCDDDTTATYPGATEIADGEDNDCDGYKDEGTTAYDDDGDCFCEDDTCTGSSSSACGAVEGGDCDDTDEAINPGATEVCDGDDNNCDGEEDEATASDARAWYVDADSDTYGSTSDSITACDAPTGYVLSSTDCDDGNSAINPAATEVCNEVDDDCDLSTDEGVETTYYRDADSDGYGNAASTDSACAAPTGYVSNDDDCDDSRLGVYPGATETCNSLDDDCDGTTDESDASDASTWYRDADSDTYGTSSTTTVSCSAPTGYVSRSGDCNDSSSSVSPAVTETCNSVDDDCDGTTDESDASDASTWYYDGDSDGYGVSSSTKKACTKPTGYSAYSTDCNDSSAAISPADTEICNSADDDCDGSTDEGVTTTYYKDTDSDGYGTSTSTTTGCSTPTGYATSSTDCNDSSSSINPAATEKCDSVDNDCDGSTDESSASDASTWYYDGDSDGYGTSTSTTKGCSKPTGYSSYSTDCNDSSSSISPAATEKCDSLDNDCDGTTDEASATGCTTYYYDYDSDGYGTTTSSCLCAKSGYYTSTVSTDCYDSNANANPGATTTYWSSNRGDGSYDYDCDGTASKYYTSVYDCDTDWTGFSCDGYTNGFSSTSSIPSCGGSASYRSGCSASWFSCSYTSSTTYYQYCK